MGKKIPLWLVALIVFLCINLAVLFGWSVQYVNEGGDRLGKLGPVVTTIASFPSLVKEALYEVGLLSYKARNEKAKTITRPPQLIKNRFPDLDGLKKNGVLQEGAANDDGYLLISSYDHTREQSTVKLVRIRDEHVVHEWVPDIKKLASLYNHDNLQHPYGRPPSHIRPTRYRITHPLLSNDGSLVFHNGNGPLFKADACSDIVWIIDKQFHHANEADSGGDIWVSTYLQPADYLNENIQVFLDEGIARISPDGTVLFEKSVAEILDENGYRGLLFGAGLYERKDLVHINDIQPAYYSTDYWEKDDLLISLRNRSAVFLYRPSTNKVLWLKVGPWLHQHDADFVGQSKVSIFGNDVVRRVEDRHEPFINGHNDIYIFDFEDGSISTPYSSTLEKEEVRTGSEGLHEILDNGDVFIEETMEGRLLRLSKDGAIWEAAARVDENTLALLSWSRYLTQSQVERILPALKSAKCP